MNAAAVAEAVGQGRVFYSWVGREPRPACCKGVALGRPGANALLVESQLLQRPEMAPLTMISKLLHSMMTRHWDDLWASVTSS